MQILNIAGYKFISLSSLDSLRAKFLNECTDLGLKGTILLSKEGINMNLAGFIEAVRKFQLSIQKNPVFQDVHFHETFSTTIPFKLLKVKIKKEIITLRLPEVDVVAKRAPMLTASELKQWLDEKRDFVLLDTRNEFEVEMGTFNKAVDLKLKDFGEFPEKAHALDRQKTIVMFCTGGIRCEKAALYLQNQGFDRVYQLAGGILGYFAEVGGEYYKGKCFVFDERVSVEP